MGTQQRAIPFHLTACNFQTFIFCLQNKGLFDFFHFPFRQQKLAINLSAVFAKIDESVTMVGAAAFDFPDIVWSDNIDAGGYLEVPVQPSVPRADVAARPLPAARQMKKSTSFCSTFTVSKDFKTMVRRPIPDVELYTAPVELYNAPDLTKSLELGAYDPKLVQRRDDRPNVLGLVIQCRRS